MTSDFVVDALEQAIHARRPGEDLIHLSDQGSSYMSIRSTERLVAVGMRPLVGSLAESDDNTLAESVNGLYRAEVVWQRGPWEHGEFVELGTLKWVDWSNSRRPLEPIGRIPPAEFEAKSYRTLSLQQPELVRR